jgi:hypothetical protein
MTNSELLTAWIEDVTNRSLCVEVIALLKKDVLRGDELARAIKYAPWHLTKQASSWSRLFMDSMVCAGFHRSEAWWGGLAKASDIRSLPLRMAEMAVRHVEAVWQPERPSAPGVRASMALRGRQSWQGAIDVLKGVAPADPVTSGVLNWIAMIPNWSGEHEFDSALGAARAAWPHLAPVCDTADGLFDSEVDRVAYLASNASALPTIERSLPDYALA